MGSVISENPNFKNREAPFTAPLLGCGNFLQPKMYDAINW